MSAAGIKEACLPILKSILNHDIGFPTLPTSSSSLPTTETELLKEENDLLKRYDQLLSLSLERRILEAELALYEDNGDNTEDMDTDIDPSRTKIDITNAKAKNYVKDLIIRDLIITKPILQAIHSSPSATNRERSLLPYLQDRDRLSSLALHLHSQLNTLNDETADLSRRLVGLNNKNRKHVARIMQLTASKRIDLGRSPELVETERKMKVERRKWEMIKGVVQGVVIGSGLNLAEHDDLMDLVLACGEDDDDEEEGREV